MALQSIFKRHWKIILNVLTLIALVGLVYAIREQLVDTLRNLRNVNLWILALIVPIEALNYHAQTKMYQQLFAVVGNKLSYKFLFRAALELNFVNHVFPSGGVSGISYFGLRLRDGQKISASKATLVQVMKLVLVVISFEALIVAGVFFLAIAGKSNNLILMLAASLSTILVVGTLVFAYIIGTKRRINEFFTVLTRWINMLIHLVRPHHPETISIEKAKHAFDDLHENYIQFRSHYKELRWPLWWAFIANVTEIAALYVVFAAFNEWVNVGAVILAYAVANFAGFVSVLPGGVGVFEALMTAALVAGGIPASLSLPVIVMYRVVNTMIQVPPGYYFYHKTLKSTGKAV